MVKAKKEHFRKQIEQSSGDQRATWKVLNDLMGKKSDSTQINELKTDLRSISDCEIIAECLSNHFANAGPRLASEIPTLGNTVDPLHILEGINSIFFFFLTKGQILVDLNETYRSKYRPGNRPLQNI